MEIFPSWVECNSNIREILLESKNATSAKELNIKDNDIQCENGEWSDTNTFNSTFLPNLIW